MEYRRSRAPASAAESVTSGISSGRRSTPPTRTSTFISRREIRARRFREGTRRRSCSASSSERIREPGRMKDLARLALDTAAARGASYADVRAIEFTREDIQVKNGEVGGLDLSDS